MTAGQAAADRLRARHRAPSCTRCQEPVARVVAAYWDPATRLCPACCLVVAAGFGEDPSNWPPRPQPQEPAA